MHIPLSLDSSTKPYSNETKRSLLSNINSNSPKLKLRNQKTRLKSSNQLLTKVKLIEPQERISLGKFSSWRKNWTRPKRI